jgi:uncharacterized protein (TIGR03435 family)
MIILVSTGLLCASEASGQPPAAPSAPPASQQANRPPAFEVASVKPSPAEERLRGGCHGIDSIYTPAEKADAPPLGWCVIAGARLGHLVFIAWKLGSMTLLESGSNWIARGEERFNVVAKAEDPSKATEQQLLAMLQALLVERRQMKFHWKAMEVAGFALEVAKNGPKLHESERERADLTWNQAGPAQGRLVSLTASRCSMAKLIAFLSTSAGYGQWIDRTGLAGFYDFTLTWDDDLGPTLPTELRDQLGLQMESQKVPVSYFVIDSAQRPSEN